MVYTTTLVCVGSSYGGIYCHNSIVLRC